MATGSEVLTMLIPSGGWVITGDDFEGIQFLDAKPITKAQFEAGFDKVDAWKAQQDLAAQTAKDLAQAKLEALGLTTDDLKALGL
jgi:hypothetical protein